MDKALTIKIPRANTYYYSYYFFSTQGIRTPETPMVNSTVSYYSTNHLLQNETWLSSICQTITFRFYPLEGKNTFLDFENKWLANKDNNKIVSISLSPVSKFDKLEKPVFIGQYNPFIMEPDTQQYLLESYYVGNQIGLSHELARIKTYFFEMQPKMYLLLDFEKVKDTIKRKNIPFGGYLNSNTE